MAAWLGHAPKGRTGPGFRIGQGTWLQENGVRVRVCLEATGRYSVRHSLFRSREQFGEQNPATLRDMPAEG